MKTNSKNLSGIKVTAAVKAGGLPPGNHNRRALAVKTNIKAGEGIASSNHNRRPLNSGIKVTATVKAGGLPPGNHNRRALAVKTNIKAGEGIASSNHNRAPLNSGIKVTATVALAVSRRATTTASCSRREDQQLGHQGDGDCESWRSPAGQPQPSCSRREDQHQGWRGDRLLEPQPPSRVSAARGSARLGFICRRSTPVGTLTARLLQCAVAWQCLWRHVLTAPPSFRVLRPPNL